MRSDAIGIFWQDVPRKKGDKTARIMPPIPDTGWTPPTHYPDLSRAHAISIDVETYDPELKKRGPGWARGKGHICGVAIGTDDGLRLYYPVRHTIEKDYNVNPEHLFDWLRDSLGDKRQPKLGANITYDVGWLREERVVVQGKLYDVQFAEALLRESDRVNLDELGERYLGTGKKTSTLYDWCSSYYGGKPTQDQRKNIYRSPPRLVGPYAEGDVDLPFKILTLQWPLLAQQGLLNLFEMESDLIYLMVEMRRAGVSVDIPQAERLYKRMEDEITGLDQQVRSLVGFGVEVWAAESISQAFDTMGIPYGRTTTGRPSFTAGFLKTVNHPLGKLLHKIRERDKLKNTFIKGYILESNINGKIFCQFHQLRGDAEGARSGRYASSTPNLQNIPVRSELGKEIRKCFIPDYGHQRWRKNDYNQIEYRGLAHYAIGPGADEVRARYNSDRTTDFHALLQQLVFEITGQKLERPLVKNVNFGSVYGMGEKKLAAYLGLSRTQARALFEAIHNGAPFMRATLDATMKEAQWIGYITTIMGRRSRFDLWVPGGWTDDEEAKRPLPYEMAVLRYMNPTRAYLHKSLNRRLQGTAADIIKAAMLKCYQDGIFDVTGVPRLTVHDELDFSDPGGKEEAFREMKYVMETALPLRVPILVENEVGPSWGEVQKVA